jgi:hypothetical protein
MLSTAPLEAWNSGEEDTLELLAPLVYEEVHRLAQCYLAHEPASRGMGTVPFVYEAYQRLAESGQINSRNRAQFSLIAAPLTRRILVDWARSKAAPGGHGAELPALDAALHDLSKRDPRKSQVVELRFFAGLGVEEAAEVLHISPETAGRDWKFAKTWLLRELKKE